MIVMPQFIPTRDSLQSSRCDGPLRYRQGVSQNPRASDVAWYPQDNRAVCESMSDLPTAE